MVRVGHWALAGFFFLAYWLGGERLNLHAHAGYTVALLIVFRVIWGLIGPGHARFRSFLASPRRVLEYLKRLAGSRAAVPVYAGHDPAGAVMIVALLVTLTVVACSGMVLFGMEDRGPLPRDWVSDWPGSLVEAVHHAAADLSLILVAAHVLGVLVMSVLTRQPLIGAMIHGRKRVASVRCSAR